MRDVASFLASASGAVEADKEGREILGRPKGGLTAAASYL